MNTEKIQAKPFNIPPELCKKAIQGEITLGQLVGLSNNALYTIANIAYQSLEAGHPEKALPLYEGLVAASPFDSVFHCQLAATYYALNQLDKAFSHYNSSIQFNRHNVDALTGRGELFLLRKQLCEAADDFKLALLADPKCTRRSTLRAQAALTMLAQAVEGLVDK